MLSAGFIVAIGSQNAFVLQQGLARRHVGAIVAVCILGDILLMTAGAFGFGNLLKQWPLLTPIISAAGALFLIAYALRAARRVFATFHPALIPQNRLAQSLSKALAMAAAFTFLNPHVYLDTVILLGTMASAYEGVMRLIFVSGAMTASILWFSALGFGGRWLGPVFSKPIAWRVLDFCIAISMLTLGARLLFRAWGGFFYAW